MSKDRFNELNRAAEIIKKMDDQETELAKKSHHHYLELYPLHICVCKYLIREEWNALLI